MSQSPAGHGAPGFILLLVLMSTGYAASPTGTAFNLPTLQETAAAPTVPLQAQNFTSGVIAPVGTVNVRSLPAANKPVGPGIAVPFLVPDPAAHAAAKKQAEQLGFKPPSKNIMSDKIASSTTPTVPGIVSTFVGLNRGTAGNWYPPDPQVAAGPFHVVELVNVLGEIWTKSGTPVETFSLYSLFLATHSCGTNTCNDFIGDVKVLFDAQSGRWLASVFDSTDNGNTGSVAVAVSSSSDPTGSWTVYKLPPKDSLGSILSVFPDQPITGVSDDKVAISANLFGPGFTGAEYWILNKNEMLTGSNVDVDTFGPYGAMFSVHPVHSLSSTTTQFMVSVGGTGASNVKLFSVTGVPPGVVTVTTINLSLLQSSTLAPPDAQQPTSAILVNTGDARVQDAAWYQGTLWLSLNDACTPQGDTSARSCARFIQINTATSTVAQDFDFGAVGQYYFYPALRIDKSGNLHVVFGFSSLTDYPGIRVTWQASGSPNTLVASQLLQSGSGPNESGRYGDYFGAGLDPSDPTLVWVVGQYGLFPSTSWGTFIGSIRFNANTLSISSVGTDIIKANSGLVIYVLPDWQSNHPKPSGVGTALLSDFTALGFTYGASTNTQILALDTNSTYFDSNTGAPKISNGIVVAFAGPLVNSVVQYYENAGTSPLYFQWTTISGTTYTNFYNRQGSLLASMPAAQVGVFSDTFLLEYFTDANNNKVFVIYGFGWKGTYVGGVFFKTFVLPSIASFTHAWYIYQWTDLNGNGLPDPYEVNTTPVNSGD